MTLVILPSNSLSGSYDITNSLRFNSGSSDYLSRTPASSGNRRTWTYSTWIKRSAITSTQEILNVTSGSYSNTEWVRFLFEDVDTIGMQLDVGVNNVKTVAVFRDVSAWYHLLFAVDTTQATNTNRLKLYVNGTQITSFTGTYVAQNSDTGVNHTLAHNISRNNVGTNCYLNGYVAETYLIDGQALTPSSFGETDEDTGIWKPKAYTGTYGTNGFYLQFKNSASLGTDSSGNGNTFTVNNLTSVDQSTDTPTNNFCLLNPLDVTSEGQFTLTEGNTKGVGTAGVYRQERSTFYVDKGKWFWEVKVLGVPSTFQIGVVQANYSSGSGDRRMYQSAGLKYTTSGSAGSYGATFTTNDIIGVALDMDNGTLVFYKNGTSQGTAFTDLISGVTLTGWTPAMLGDEAPTFSVNFGNPNYSANSYTDGAGFGNFSYSVPSGFYALNTKNLANFG